MISTITNQYKSPTYRRQCVQINVIPTSKRSDTGPCYWNHYSGRKNVLPTDEVRGIPITPQFPLRPPLPGAICKKKEDEP